MSIFDQFKHQGDLQPFVPEHNIHFLSSVKINKVTPKVIAGACVRDLYISVKHGLDEFVRVLLKVPGINFNKVFDSTGITVLAQFILDRDLNAAQKALNLGASTKGKNLMGYSPLRIAVDKPAIAEQRHPIPSQDEVAIVLELLRAGAVASKSDNRTNTHKGRNNTMLDAAIRSGFGDEVIRGLIKAGAKDSSDALAQAARIGQIQDVATYLQLIQAGGDPEVTLVFLRNRQSVFDLLPSELSGRLSAELQRLGGSRKEIVKAYRLENKADKKSICTAISARLIPH